LLNACRVLRDVEREEQRVPLNELLQRADITWHGVKLGEPGLEQLVAQHRAHGEGPGARVRRIT
jgi:hypothetical protein